jgi:predicted small secreted protein
MKSQVCKGVRLTLSIAASLALSCTAMLSSACNTTEGIGEDISATGDAIDRAAEDAKD